MKKHNFYIRNFRCPVCNTYRQATKKSCHKTSAGHLKFMWCCVCKEERNFEQVE